MRRLDLAGQELPSSIEAFVERHLGSDRQLTLRLARGVFAQRRSNFLETRYKVNRIGASQRLRSSFYETPYKHLISDVSGETKCLLCLVAKV